MAHGLSYSLAFEVFPDQGLNLCLLHWQADSLPLSHQGNPTFLFYWQRNKRSKGCILELKSHAYKLSPAWVTSCSKDLNLGISILTRKCFALMVGASSSVCFSVNSFQRSQHFPAAPSYPEQHRTEGICWYAFPNITCLFRQVHLSHLEGLMKVTQSCLTLCDHMDYIVHRNSPGQNTGVGSLSLLQGIFPIQGLNPGLLNCRQILYQLSHKKSPRILEWVAYPFSSGSSQPRNQDGVSCIAGRFFTNWGIREIDNN